MELNIASVADLAKFDGWTIKGPALQTAGTVDPELVFRIEHPAAARPVRLRIGATVTFGRSGNVMVANASLQIKTEDIHE